jgi:hypothetical protein
MQESFQVGSMGMELESKSKKDSVTLACRLDKTLYDLLKEDAKKRGVSLNSLINSIAKRYLSWEKYADGVGFVPLAKDTVRLLFDNLEERKLQKIAHHLGKTIPRELILLMFNKVDLNSITSFIEITSSRYGMVQHNISRDAHDFVIYHSVNKKFSSFLGEALKAMAEDLSFKAEVLVADSKILSARIMENSDNGMDE